MSVLLADLSNNNPDPPWQKLHREGVAGVWLKASEGESFTDPTYKGRRWQAQAAGLHVGGYHFAGNTNHGTLGDPIREAHRFTSTVGQLHPGDLLPVLDLERGYGHPPADLVTWAREFNHAVRRDLGRFPLFYTDLGFALTLDPGYPVGAGLWLADWGPNDGEPHPARPPHPWKHILAHQYTSQGHIGGYGPVDLTTAATLRPLLHQPGT